MTLTENQVRALVALLAGIYTREHASWVEAGRPVVHNFQCVDELIGALEDEGLVNDDLV